MISNRKFTAMNHFEFRPFYRRNLPHVQPLGTPLFVTFRLAGSLPQNVVAQWKEERLWLTKLARTNPFHYQRVKDDFDRGWFAKFELLLDGAVHGPLWLRDERVAAIVAEALHYRDGKVYRLHAFSIMPNHVHVVFKPLPAIQSDYPADEALASIMHSLKGYTAFKANRLLGRQGEFWAHESYDHFIRDGDEWRRIVAYVLNNPVKARYVKNWKDWNWSYRCDANW